MTLSSYRIAVLDSAADGLNEPVRCPWRGKARRWIMTRKRTKITLFSLALPLTALVACGSGDYAAKPESDSGPAGPARNPNQLGESIFGEGGISLQNLQDGRLLGSGEGGSGGSLPVNKYLWQASLDTLSFMPLNSTDPFTGVIATDWSSAPSTPNERFKVTVYVVTPELAASALKVAVFREARGENGVWIPSVVNPETPRQIEDAILTRARQIKIAEIDDSSTG